MSHSRSRRLLLTMIITSLVASAAAFSARAAEPTASGLWQRLEDRKPSAWFLLFERSSGYEGIIAKRFLEAGDDPDERCTKCRDDRKDAPRLGIPLIRGMARNGLTYENSNILDPRTGSVWKAKMALSPDGQTLTVHGHVAIPLFGMDDTWTRLPVSAAAVLDPAIAAKYLPAGTAYPSDSAKPKGNNAAR